MATIFEKDGRKCVKIETRIIMHRGVKEDGTKYNFPEYQYLDKNLKWRKLKYNTKTVSNVPQTNCFIFVPTDKLHVEDELRSKYPAMWVDEIVGTEAVMGTATPIDYETIHTKQNPLDLL